MAETEDITRKRLRFRAWHRGTKELDLIFGPFADAHLAAFDREELEQFEALLAIPDPVIMDWVLYRIQSGPGEDNALLERVVNFANRKA